jgi:carbon monoxide dehydrogenase subunit G
MKFELKEDLAVPIDAVFAEVTDFSSFERSILRRGADVERLDKGQGYGIGSTWKLSFPFRGKEREARSEIVFFDAPNSYRADSVSSGIDVVSVVDLVALSRSRTRLSVTVEMTAKTLSARLLLQSMKLAKGTLNKRFKHRLAEFAKDVEERRATK